MTAENKSEMVNEILTLADKLFRLLLPTVPKELLLLDVTMPQLKILLLLYFKGPLKMNAIGSELDVTLPTATSLVDRLVEKELVIRESQTDDRRIVLCRLSPSGEKVVRGIWESTSARSRKLLDRIDVDYLQKFIQVLQEALKAGAIVLQEYSQEKKESRN